MSMSSSASVTRRTAGSPATSGSVEVASSGWVGPHLAGRPPVRRQPVPERADRVGRPDDRGAAPPLPPGPVGERAPARPGRRRPGPGSRRRSRPPRAGCRRIPTARRRAATGPAPAASTRDATKQCATGSRSSRGRRAGRSAPVSRRAAPPSLSTGQAYALAGSRSVPDLMSTWFVRTLREEPAEAEVPSHRLLLRAGYVRRVAAGRVRLAAARPEGAAQRRADRPRGDGPDRRPGGAVPGAAAARAVRGDRPVGPRTGRTSSGWSTGAAPTTCSRRPTRSCSRCWPRPSWPRTRTCRCRSTRCRRSSGTSRGRGPGCCAPASS